jgi:hypothetical protein
MHRAHAAAIDERPHAEHQIGIGVRLHGTPGERSARSIASEQAVGAILALRPADPIQ